MRRSARRISAKPNCWSATSPPPRRRRKQSVALADRAGDAFQMDGQPHDPGRRAPRRRRMGEGRGSVRRSRAAAAGAAAGIALAVFGARVSVLRPAALAGAGRRGARPGGADLGVGATAKLGSRRRARYFDPRPRPSRPGAAEPGERAFGRDRARRCARRRRQARRGCRRPARLRAKRHMSLAACSPAPLSAAPSATGTARRAISTRSQEIAEPGPMRLYLCDCALERARLALARREAFAPLNGLVEPSPPPPALPDAAEAARLLEEARKAARRGAQAHRRMRLSPPRRGTRRARRGRRRPPPLRRFARRASEARQGRDLLDRSCDEGRDGSVHVGGASRLS